MQYHFLSYYFLSSSYNCSLLACLKTFKLPYLEALSENKEPACSVKLCPYYIYLFKIFCLTFILKKDTRQVTSLKT